MKQKKKTGYCPENVKSSQKEKCRAGKYMPYIILWILFFIMVFLQMGMKPDTNTWMPLTIISGGISIVILVKNKMPSKKYIILSIIFMILATVAYLGVLSNLFLLLIYGIVVGVPTLLSSLAVFSVMEKHGGYSMISKKNQYSFWNSIMIAVMVGAILSVINTFLGVLSGSEIAFEFSIMKLLVCLSPAIFEEMACRAIFMAYSVYFAGNDKMNGFGTFTMYFMMCMPHTLAHGYPLSSTIILCVLFGIPFTILQRKRDIASAMMSHGLVDAVRFTLIGL
ncbi:MAG: CPBP family intramembrane metalloprotease [Lachnospiraceae bacterium]|nr:CPBP family intramembrane metalloprotease [Lachnospiraceae bacterium]